MGNIYKVAAAAGVSPKTAARILAGQSLRSKNRDAVLEAAKRLGYVRNQQAANLRSGKTSVIGVVVPNVNNPFYAKVIQTLHDSFQNHGFSILLGSSFGSLAEEARALETLVRYRVDGLVLNAAERPVGGKSLEICKGYLEQNGPVAVAGELEDSLPDVVQVELQTEKAMREAVRYLVEKGHRRFGFLGGPELSLGMRDRMKGFCEAVRESGAEAPSDAVVFLDRGEGDVGEIVELWNRLPREEKPSAFIAGNDMIAISALKAFEELSLRVPNDVAVLGFDGIELGELVSPSLTTLEQPIECIARDLADWMVTCIQNGNTEALPQLSYELKLVARDSA